MNRREHNVNSLQAPLLTTLRRGGLLCVAALFAANSGCSVITSDQKIDISPLSDGIIVLTADIRYGMAGITPAYIRQHIRGPAAQETEEIAEEIRTAVKAVVSYSVRLSEIGRGDIQPQQKAYADLLLDLGKLPIQREWAAYPRSMEELEVFARTVAAEKQLLRAVKVGQPVVEDFIKSTEKQLAAFELAFKRTMLEILSGIEQEHEEVFEFEASSRHAQNLWLRDTWSIFRYRQGDDSALENLIARRPFVRNFFERGKPDLKELQRIEEYAMSRIRLHGEFLQYLQPRLSLYHKQLDEAEKIKRQIHKKLRSVHIALISWRRVHQELANGVVDPAKIDVAKLAASLIKLP